MKRTSKKKILLAIGTVLAVSAAMAPMAFADVNVKDVVQSMLGYVVDIFICIGVLLGVWAVGQLALAFKNEDADSKSRAMMMLVVAAILIGIKALAKTILNGTGFEIKGGFLSGSGS